MLNNSQHSTEAIVWINGKPFNKNKILQHLSTKTTHLTNKQIWNFVNKQILYMEACRKDLFSSPAIQQTIREAMIREAANMIYRQFKPPQNISSNTIQQFAEKHLSHLFHSELRTAQILIKQRNGIWQPQSEQHRLITLEQAYLMYGVSIANALFSIQKIGQSKQIKISSKILKIELRSLSPAITSQEPTIQGYLRQRYLQHLKKQYIRMEFKKLFQKYKVQFQKTNKI